MITKHMPNRSLTSVAALATRVVDLETSERRAYAGLGNADCAPRWFVLHTRARQEKAVARALDAANVQNYLPLIVRASYRGRQKCTVEDPLFPSYLFLHGPLEATYFATATKRVANVIRVADQGHFAHQIDQIRLVLGSGGELGPHRYLEVGRRVRVTAGPFRGIEGLIEERSKADRLVLQVAALGRATSLEIDEGLLELVE